MTSQAWAHYFVTQSRAQANIAKASMLHSRNYCMIQPRTTKQTCACELAPLQERFLLAERDRFRARQMQPVSKMCPKNGSKSNMSKKLG